MEARGPYLKLILSFMFALGTKPKLPVLHGKCFSQRAISTAQTIMLDKYWILRIKKQNKKKPTLFSYSSPIMLESVYTLHIYIKGPND